MLRSLMLSHMPAESRAGQSTSFRYTGKISIRKAVATKYSHGVLPVWEEIRPTPRTGCNPEQGWPAWPRCASNLAAFSAVCWYSGRNLFDKMGGNTPVGLMQASVGGSPIEYWLPPTGPYPPSTVNSNPCETDRYGRPLAAGISDPPPHTHTHPIACASASAPAPAPLPVSPSHQGIISSAPWISTPKPLFHLRYQVSRVPYSMSRRSPKQQPKNNNRHISSQKKSK